MATPTTGPAPLSVGLDASASTALVPIASYVWSFDDGTPAVSGVKTTHTFTSGGITRTVTLKVTDSVGQTATTTLKVVVTMPPIAAFTESTSGVQVKVFDASGSTDPDGTVAAYAWDFGDGTTGTGVKPTHTYANGGTYTVKLTVTDNSGASASAAQAVVVTTNKPPVAAFALSATSGVSPLAVKFDASATYDPDGTLTKLSWDFGDGTGAQSTSVTHLFRPGTFTVTLKATDASGAVATVTRTVESSPPLRQNLPAIQVATSTDSSTGSTFTCVLDSGAVSCAGTWGPMDPDANPDQGPMAAYANTGNNSRTVYGLGVPVQIATSNGAYIYKAPFGDGQEGLCALTSSGTVICPSSWANPKGVTYQPKAGLTDVVALTARGAYTCALGSEGSVYCWSPGSAGVPALVPGLGKAVSIAAGSRHVCAVLSDGTTWCWGANESGQLGNGTYSTRTQPTKVSLGTGPGGKPRLAVQVAAGDTSSCALSTDALVLCWGNRNNVGYYSDPTTPTNVPGSVGIDNSSTSNLTDVVSLGSGASCATRVDGSLWCWHQQGNYALPGPNYAQKMTGFVGAEAASTGTDNLCASTTSSTVLCAGANEMGELGNRIFGTSISGSYPVGAPSSRPSLWGG